MKKLLICLLVFIVMIVSACAPLVTATPELTATPEPTATPLPAEKMTFNRMNGPCMDIYVINEKGQYLVRIGYKIGTIESGPTLNPDQYNQGTVKQGRYTSDAVRELLSLMLNDITDDQYVSDELYFEFAQNSTRGSNSFGSCNSTISITGEFSSSNTTVSL